MSRLHEHLLAAIAIILIAFLSPVMANENLHHSCDNDTTIEFKPAGMMNEEALQELLDKTKQHIKMFRHSSRTHLSRKQEQKQNISEIVSAMQVLHNQMYVGGCKQAAHGASLETRVEVLEKRVMP